MKFGIVAPTFPPINNLIRIAKRIEEKKYYDSFWFSDHLMGWYPQSIWTPDITALANRFPSPHMFFEPFTSMGYVAAKTHRIKLGVGVTETFRRHPAVLLQEAVTVDHASNGRIILGLGAGEAENVVPYGIKFKNHASRLKESLEIIKLLIDSDIGETINFNGKFFKLENAVFDIKPVSDLPIWIGAHGDMMLKICAKYADYWFPTMLNPIEYSERANKLDKYADSEGRQVKKALYATLIVDETEKEVSRLLDAPLLKIHALLLHHKIYEKYGYRHPFGKYYGLIEYIPTKFKREDILKVIAEIPKEIVKNAFLYGTPDQIIQKLEEYEKAGLDYVVFWNLTYFGDADKIRISYNLIDEIVKNF